MNDHEQYWAEQKQLPLRKRDGLWWTEVGLNTVVVWVFIIGGALGFLLGLLGLI